MWLCGAPAARPARPQHLSPACHPQDGGAVRPRPRPPRGSCPPWAGRCRRGPPPLSPRDESISPHCHVSRVAGAVQGRAGAPRPDRPACLPASLLFSSYPFPCSCPAAGQRRGGSARREEGRSAGLPPPPPQPRSPRAGRGLPGSGLAAGPLPPEGTPLPADVRAAPPPALGCVSTAPPLPWAAPGELRRHRRAAGCHRRSPLRNLGCVSVCGGVSGGEGSAGFVPSCW